MSVMSSSCGVVNGKCVHEGVDDLMLFMNHD
jgi:hypothetical protein